MLLERPSNLGVAGPLFLAAFILTTVAGPIYSQSEKADSGPEASTQRVYRDKNGYFSFAPPAGWVRLDYPDDPRSKVQFTYPSSTSVHLRLIAALAPPHMNQANFVNLMRQDMETMRARLGSALRTIELQQRTFAAFPAAFVRASTTAGEQELTLFLADKLFFNVSYEAPDVETLVKHRRAVEESLETLLVGKPSGATRTKIRGERVARYLRLAKLMSEAGQFDTAREFLEDGLQEYPKEPALSKALESALAQTSGKTPAEAPQELAAGLYSDPKGFFQIRPPAGWSINEYPDDPRGKVDFRIPAAGDWRQSGAELKVIAALNAPGRDIAAARAEIEGSAERLRARLGASVTVTETTLLGAPAVTVRIDQPGKLRQDAIEVLITPNRYNFTFGAAPHRYEQYYPIAIKSIETLLPIPRDLPKEEATRHLVASHIRTAELYRHIGQRGWALEAVDEGLRLDPSNEKLLQMKRALENR